MFGFLFFYYDFGWDTIRNYRKTCRAPLQLIFPPNLSVHQYVERVRDIGRGKEREREKQRERERERKKESKRDREIGREREREHC